MVVIGLDFGNFNSYPSYIDHFDPNSRIGGMPRELFPTIQQYRNGIPSAYFCSPTKQIFLGADAIKSTARPLSNRLRYLKRSMGKTVNVKNKDHQETIPVSIDEAITAVIGHCVRIANVEMKKNYQLTTNLISLAYPATFTAAQRQHLISLAEKATLEDGTKVKVFGTIAEPAAAALDFLADEQTDKKDTTVLTYDLGGGTFDLGLVAAYPKGRLNKENKRYYYDIIDTDGLPRVGGREFDDVMFELLKSQIAVPLSDKQERKLREEATIIKEELSTSASGREELIFDVGDEEYALSVSRREFEQKARPILMKTINLTTAFIKRHEHQKPQCILLSGAASQMPMVKAALEEALPQYRGKIQMFRPTMAISYGAARYGTVESNEDPSCNKTTIQKRVSHDMGIRYYKTGTEDKYIDTVIKAGTELPFKPVIKGGILHDASKSVVYRIYEANKSDPDSEAIDRDWSYIMKVEVDFGRTLPKGAPSQVEIAIDALGRLNLAARDTSIPGQPEFKNSTMLQNLS